MRTFQEGIKLRSKCDCLLTKLPCTYKLRSVYHTTLNVETDYFGEPPERFKVSTKDSEKDIWEKPG